MMSTRRKPTKVKDADVTEETHRWFERDGVRYEVPRPALLAIVVRAALLNALAYTGGNRTAAASLLGISFRTLRHNMTVYGIPRE